MIQVVLAVPIPQADLKEMYPDVPVHKDPQAKFTMNQEGELLFQFDTEGLEGERGLAVFPLPVERAVFLIMRYLGKVKR